jgi:hypothetical protein
MNKHVQQLQRLLQYHQMTTLEYQAVITAITIMISQTPENKMKKNQELEPTREDFYFGALAYNSFIKNNEEKAMPWEQLASGQKMFWANVALDIRTAEPAPPETCLEKMVRLLAKGYDITGDRVTADGWTLIAKRAMHLGAKLP